MDTMQETHTADGQMTWEQYNAVLTAQEFWPVEDSVDS